MKKIVETFLYLRDDQIVKRGSVYGKLDIAAGVFCIVLGVSILVLQCGPLPESIHSAFDRVSHKLIQYANATSPESGTVVQTAETTFLGEMASVITGMFIGSGLLLLACGLYIQAGVLAQRLKTKIEESPTKPSNPS